MKYRLNSAENVPVTLYNVAKTKKINGKSIVTFRNHKRKVRYKKDLADILTKNGVPFELEMCRSCGGRVKKISYQVVEVYEDE